MKESTTDELALSAPGQDASLTELQEWMAKILRHRRSLTKSQAMQEAASGHFAGNERLSPAEQVNIYRTQFWLRHTNCLLEDFPGVSRILGQKNWERVAESYLTTVGYGEFALSDLGRDMPEHLMKMKDLPHQKLLVDMARLECAYDAAFAVEDDPVLSSDDVGNIPAAAWERARMQLSHSLSLIHVDYPVARLRRLIRDEDRGLTDEELSQKEELFLVVYRRDGTLWDKAISATAFSLLEKFQRGLGLVSACEKVVAERPEAEAILDAELMSWFSLWGRLGWITAVHTGV